MLLYILLAGGLHTSLAVSLAGVGPRPVVNTTGSSWVGKTDLLGKIDSFLGIPYAQPPVGELRFAPPISPASGFGTFDASKFGHACPQPNGLSGASPKVLDTLSKETLALLSEISFFNEVVNGAEDCLSLNIQRPAGISSDAKLPILFWIYGGAFASRGTSVYDGASIVNRSVAMGSPSIYVSVNYRINSFGFLPGREVADDPTASVNAGLMDQRLALDFVQKNIVAFGGHPSKVTLFGQSAGAISIGFHLMAFDGKVNGLFRGAIMESGSPIPVEGTARGQPSFDSLAVATKCDQAAEKIKCLRAVPYLELLTATSSLPGGLSYHSLSLPFLPRTDGYMLTDQMQTLFREGKYAQDIPILTGDAYDEGTLQALGTLNITTSEQLDHWLATNWFPNTTVEQRAKILELYPDDPTQGSPFDSGMMNVLTPQNKRVNAIVGDMIFQTCRRFLLSFTSRTQPSWSYSGRMLQVTPLIGSFHASEIFNVYGVSPLSPTAEIQSRWIAFANNLDPNVPGYLHWPQYGSNKTNIQFSETGSKLVPDTYREAPIAYWSTIFDDLAL